MPEDKDIGLAPYRGKKAPQIRKGRKLTEANVIEIRKSAEAARSQLGSAFPFS